MLNLCSTHYKSLGAVLLLSVLLSVSFNTRAQTPPAITIPYSAYHTPAYPNYYYEEVLKLALAKTEPTYGKLEIKFYPFSTGRERQRAILKIDGGLDLIWSSSSHLREEKLLAIKFNLLRDLSDYKILLIRKEDKAKFAKVRHLNDLRKFKAGTGSHWQDTKILQLNSMPFITSWDYEPMFKMLVAKRFDYMLRGSQEIWTELEQHQNLPIIAEEKLLIRYNLPVYFFVNPKNAKLAERIKKGLDLAEKDGSLNKLFMSLPAFKRGLEEINKKNKVIINMDDEEVFE